MILKQLRISRHLSQEQLAQMSGLNVRTIQRIESGHKASVESLKCLAAVFEVDVSTLNQEKFMIDKTSHGWQTLPIWLKWWFALQFLDMRPRRQVAARVQFMSHLFGFAFCLLGLVNRAALEGGLILLSNAYFFAFLTWQGDKFGIWFDLPD
jgi:transcriptional regulator with XRE-family HTH domain